MLRTCARLRHRRLRDFRLPRAASTNQTYQRADAFLFGRRTYELFAGYWGAEERARAALEDPGNHQIAAALNTKPKYLASTTLTEPRWANTIVLSGDLAAAIVEVRCAS
jgi:dihydrofolate reductase